MPSRPPSPCPVCGEAVQGGGRCPAHRSQQYREQGNRARARDPWRWVYDDPRWKRLRDLVKLEEPFCRDGCGRRTADADHILPLSEGGAPFARANVQGLAKICHGRKTKADRIRRWREKLDTTPGLTPAKR